MDSGDLSVDQVIAVLVDVVDGPQAAGLEVRFACCAFSRVAITTTPSSLSLAPDWRMAAAKHYQNKDDCPPDSTCVSLNNKYDVPTDTGTGKRLLLTGDSHTEAGIHMSHDVSLPGTRGKAGSINCGSIAGNHPATAELF